MARAETAVVFVHVGKCAGTTVRRWLKENHVRHTLVHMRPAPQHAPKAATIFVVWVRDPIERFRSAYEWVRAVIMTNTSGMNAGALCKLGPTATRATDMCFLVG